MNIKICLSSKGIYLTTETSSKNSDSTASRSNEMEMKSAEFMEHRAILRLRAIFTTCGW
jgi:hypothetical protein